MIWKLLFLFSVLPIAATLIARWYFGIRVLATEGRRPCRFDPARWENHLGNNPPIEVDEAPAMELGKVLRLAALTDWKARDPKRAAARESSRRFGMAVPPLGLIIGVFVAIRFGVLPGLAVFLTSIAFSVLTSLLSIGTELTAVALVNRRLRESRAFTRRDDEDAVANSAIAHVWAESIPPILRFF